LSRLNKMTSCVYVFGSGECSQLGKSSSIILLFLMLFPCSITFWRR
jgi:hypothetical protein